MNASPLLSIILITRNERAHIAQAIESVIHAAQRWPSPEIILVDSASTDGTVEIACKYPITILRLPSSTFLSASAGRRVGTQNSRGEWIMFMDGDMEMAPGWLDEAIPYMQTHPEAAAVTGYRHDIYLENGQVTGENDVVWEPVGNPVEVKHFGGAALYRREALEAVGGFNPYLISEEEPELCMRLRFAGYRLFCIPVRICSNYTLPIRSWKYFINRISSRLWLGHGQTLRYHLGSRMGWMVIRERATFVFSFLLLILAAVSFILVLRFGSGLWMAAWFLLGVIGLVGYRFYKGSWQEVAKSFVHQICVLYGGLRGFVITPIPADHYSIRVEVVQSLP